MLEVKEMISEMKNFCLTNTLETDTQEIIKTKTEDRKQWEKEEEGYGTTSNCLAGMSLKSQNRE
jgi:hypothetical protein